MFGLIGKKLSHSFSKEIHEKLQPNHEYHLYELNELAPFFQEKQFKGINVTIPYKQEVIQYLDEVDSHAKALGNVNTITNIDGYTKGYNTDYYGLEYMLKFYNINLEDKIVLILGNGSTSSTIKYLCSQKKAKRVYVAARNPKMGEYNLDSLNTFNNAQIIFNSTPKGMFPNNYEYFDVDFDFFDDVRAVVDVIYNPLRSDLLIQARKHGITTANGLMMLVAQAFFASEIFHLQTYNINNIYNIYKYLVKSMVNLVLIGMPMSGKTHYAKLLSKKYNKEVIELDQYIENTNKKSIPKIFEEDGENVFRYLETLAIKDVSKQHKLAISTGGGVVLSERNIDILRQNGIMIFLDMPLHILKKGNPKGRPLLQDKRMIEKLYYDRYELYREYADILIVKESFNEDVIMNQIEVKLNEYFNLKWT